MQGLWVILSNSGGELDRAFAETEEDARDIAMELICGVANLCEGDTITVVAGERADVDPPGLVSP